MRTWDIIGNRRWGYLLSAVAILAGVIGFAVNGLNFGIDFTGGTLLDLDLGREASLNEVRQTLRPLGFEDAVIQKSADRPRQVLIRTPPLTQGQVTRVRQAFAREYGGVTVRRVDNVGPKIGRELRQKAILAVIVGLLLQVIYISWRFRSFRFAIAADLALVHDLLVVVGLFALTRRAVDSSFVAVLLTVVGYSINDTVVILDRIRESLNLRSRELFPRLVNRSMLEVLVRSLTTGFGAIIALLILYFFGGPTLRDFIFGLGIGVVTGTYSSIFVASPILVDWHNWSERRAGRPQPAETREVPPVREPAGVAAGPSGAGADGAAVAHRPPTGPRRRRSRRRR